MGLGRYDEAKTLFTSAYTWAAASDDPRTLAEVWLNRAKIGILCEDWSGSEEALSEAKAIAKRTEIPRVNAQVTRGLGVLALSRTDRAGEARERTLNRAIKYLRRAVQQLEDGGFELDAAATQERLAEALEAANQGDQARSEWQAAEARRAKLRLTAEAKSST